MKSTSIDIQSNEAIVRLNEPLPPELFGAFIAQPALSSVIDGTFELKDNGHTLVFRGENGDYTEGRLAHDLTARLREVLGFGALNVDFPNGDSDIYEPDGSSWISGAGGRIFDGPDDPIGFYPE